MENVQSQVQYPPSKIWLLAARPKTLGAAIAPVLMGTAMAWAAGGFHALAAVCALLGAMFIQIGTNFSNDYSDFLKGADTEERKGPLRVTQAGLVTPEAMKRATVIVFAMAVVAGAYLIWRGGWPILLIGVLSILSGLLYTVGRYSLAYLGLADLFVLVFFGPVAVGGTYYVQTLMINMVVIMVGFAAGLLSVAILLVNNIRDVEEDRAANKKTLVVRAGRSFGVGLYVACVLVAVLIPIGLYLFTGQHPWAMTVVLILPLAWPIVRKLRHECNAMALNPLLGATGRLLLLYSLLFSIGWML
ncbi:MAG TPA: 1,4-dihydroxy-2-naphthoate polyprenyltransferase [Rhodothermales bacterium]|nr:1,4-dihydroxy-2-naphthoate polyprenyltransferase [Rhodothermales bacterium]